MKGILGKKVGMTRIFDETGTSVPVTVVEAGPCTILATRTNDADGYSAVQLGFGERKAKNVSKALKGHLKAAGRDENPPAYIREIRLAADTENAVGDELKADLFEKDEYVDVTGTTKGRGFQGVVRRYKFGGGRKSHGGDWTRKPGSIGMCEFPGKVYKGRKMPGHMGNVRRTVQSLKVVEVDAEKNLILIKGAIPGPIGRHVIVKKALKK
ncbi:MAG: 50S ribosomal protein L3 [Lentisphaeria bacterium]|nr:50S ribosomal protein L3 [Lentisphaeria bacterium]NQZ71182.1 50S ribosomal protein L3 [Lentisphaeria bacterium]